MHHKHSKRYSTVRTHFGSSRRHHAQTQTAIMLAFAFLTIFLSIWISIIMQAS